MKHLILLLIIGTTLRGMAPKAEDRQEFLTQQKPPSDFMRRLNTLYALSFAESYPWQPIAPKHVRMWQQAQQDIGLSPEYTTPIRSFTPMAKELQVADTDDIEVYAQMTADAMYMSPLAQTKSYGVRRHTMYHEAVHHKYLDPFSFWRHMVLYPSLLFSAASYPVFAKVFDKTHTATLKKYEGHPNPKLHRLAKPLALTASAAIGILSSIAAATAFNTVWRRYSKQFFEDKKRFIERRADLEASYALKCSTCVQEVLTNKLPMSEKDRILNAAEGYLSTQELFLIACEHERKGSVCDYHKN